RPSTAEQKATKASVALADEVVVAGSSSSASGPDLDSQATGSRGRRRENEPRRRSPRAASKPPSSGCFRAAR
ncbi:hypothetical protein VTH82DRAFT_1919, partial [Thermothelomyces myriococcoides]